MISLGSLICITFDAKRIWNGLLIHVHFHIHVLTKVRLDSTQFQQFKWTPKHTSDKKKAMNEEDSLCPYTETMEKAHWKGLCHLLLRCNPQLRRTGAGLFLLLVLDKKSKTLEETRGEREDRAEKRFITHVVVKCSISAVRPVLCVERALRDYLHSSSNRRETCMDRPDSCSLWPI